MNKILIIGGLSLVFLGGIFVWGTYSLVDYSTKQIEQLKLDKKANELAKNIKKNHEFLKAECWEKVQALISIEAWTQTPPKENIALLKGKCLANHNSETATIL